jgi:hypothetical protein
VHLDDEASDDASGHEFIFVAENQVVGFVPGVVWLVFGEEAGGDEGVGEVADGVANPKFLHQLQQLVVHFGILGTAPNNFEICAGKTAVVLFHLIGVGDAIDGVGCPRGIEDDAMFEDGIFLEVEANPQVVEVFANDEHFLFIFESVGVTEAIVLFDVDIVLVLGVVFEEVADAYPGFGDGLVDVGKIGDVGGDSLVDVL